MYFLFCNLQKIFQVVDLWRGHLANSDGSHHNIEVALLDAETGRKIFQKKKKKKKIHLYKTKHQVRY